MKKLLPKLQLFKADYIRTQFNVSMLSTRVNSHGYMYLRLYVLKAEDHIRSDSRDDQICEIAFSKFWW